MALAAKPVASRASRPPNVMWSRALTRPIRALTCRTGGIVERLAESSSGPLEKKNVGRCRELAGVLPHELASLPVPPGRVQGTSDDDRVVVVRVLHLAGRQQIHVDAFVPQIVRYQVSQPLSAPACRTVGNQDSHWISPPSATGNHPGLELL